MILFLKRLTHHKGWQAAGPLGSDELLRGPKDQVGGRDTQTTVWTGTAPVEYNYRPVGCMNPDAPRSLPIRNIGYLGRRGNRVDIIR